MKLLGCYLLFLCCAAATPPDYLRILPTYKKAPASAVTADVNPFKILEDVIPGQGVVAPSDKANVSDMVLSAVGSDGLKGVIISRSNPRRSSAIIGNEIYGLYDELKSSDSEGDGPLLLGYTTVLKAIQEDGVELEIRTSRADDSPALVRLPLQVDQPRTQRK